MSKLSELYNIMDGLRNMGLPIGEELEIKANELEEELIKKEILPVLKEKIAPALQPVKRDLVLVVEHVPGQPLSVHITRKANFTEQLSDMTVLELDPEVEHGTFVRDPEKVIKRSPKTEFSVRFPDGTLIAEPKAVDTLEAVVKRIGVERVRQVVEEQELVFAKVPVISNRRDAKYGKSQRDLGGGWLLITHSSNEQKKQFLDKVSDALGLRLVITVTEK